MPTAGRVLAAITLAEWGAILTYFYCSGRLASYLHPIFRPLVLVTGILLLASAGCILCFDESCFQLACDDVGCETRHGKMALGGLLSFAVLVSPIAFAAKISPDSFGSGFIQNRGVRQTIFPAKAPPDRWASSPIFTRRSSSQTLTGPVSPGLSARKLPGSVPSSRQTSAAFSTPATSGDYRPVGILDLMRAAQNPVVRQDFDGKRVGLTGRFLPKNANHFELVCAFVTCCAVDAQLLALRVDTNDIPLLEKLTWTKVIGRVTFVKVGEDTMPVVTAETVAAIPAPKEPLVYGPTRQQLNRPAPR